MQFYWGKHRGSNLNSSWEKCGIWLINLWTPTHGAFVIYLHVLGHVSIDMMIILNTFIEYVLLYVDSCYHVCLHIFVYVCIYICFEWLCTTWPPFFCMMIVTLDCVMISCDVECWLYWLILLPWLSCSLWDSYSHYLIRLDLYCTSFWSTLSMLFILIVYSSPIFFLA